MNIFYLDSDPIIAAKMQCDKHVVKMIVESAQMLSTAHRVLDGSISHEKTKNNRNIKRWILDDKRQEILYKSTHVNHPSNIWTRESRGNYTWLYMHFKALCKEYTYRYGKQHKSEQLCEYLVYPPRRIIRQGLLPIKLAMPIEFQSGNQIESYRTYYKSKINDFKMAWTNRDVPYWLIE